MRRAIGLGVLVVVILLIALGVHSCQVSATNSALQNYANGVSSLEGRSAQTGAALFRVLASASGSTSTTVQTEVNQSLADATKQLNQARTWSVPGQVTTANGRVVLALRMRVDGISGIAGQIQQALGGTSSKSSINALAADTARFYSSDVLYKDYAVPEIYAALHAAGTPFSPITGAQFLPDVQWLLPSFLASELHLSVPGLATKKIAPGSHGHQLNSVSVDGVTLQTGSSNTIPVKPLPTFVLHFANTGSNPETAVGCKVTVNGTSVTGKATVPQTLPGHAYTCSVTLGSTPPTGTQAVVATVVPVPGEKTVTNNSQSYSVTFQ